MTIDDDAAVFERGREGSTATQVIGGFTPAAWANEGMSVVAQEEPNKGLWSGQLITVH